MSEKIDRLTTGCDDSSSPERGFRLLAESIPQLVWTARPDGRLDYANLHWTRYTGLSQELSRGWSWKRAVHPEDLPGWLDSWTTAVDRGEPYEAERRIRRHDGQYRWFLVRAEPMIDREGRTLCWFGTCTDIDEQKRRSDLREERYRRIVETANDGIMEVALDGTARFANLRMANMLGYAPQELVGRSTFDFLFEEDRDAARSDWNIQCSGNSTTSERRWRRRDGTELWTLSSCSPLLDDRGEAVGVVTVHSDLADRIEAERKLQESADLFQTSVENLLDCFGIYSAIRNDRGQIVDFRVEYVNAAACENNRLSADEQVGGRLLELMPAHRQTGLFDAYCEVVETGVPLAKEMQFYADDYAGERIERWFDIRVSKQADGFVAAWRDVTDRKRAETSIREAEQRFRLALEGSPVTVYQCDLDLRYTWIYDPRPEVVSEDLLGRRDDEVLPPEDVAELIDVKGRAIQEERSIQQTIVIRRQGKEVDYHISAEPLHDRHGNLIGLTVAAFDVTKEFDARRNEARFRLAIDGSPICVYENDLDLRFTWIVNPFFGFSLDDVIGRTDTELLPGDAAAAAISFKRDVLQSGQRVRRQLQQTVNGHSYSFDVTAEPIIDRAGNVSGVRVVVVDVTAMREAERRQREGEERFRTLADNISQLAWMADENGWIFWYNRRWYEYTGTTFEEMQGWGWKAVHHPEHVERVVARIQRSWDTGEEWEDLFPLRGVDGTYRWFLSRAVPIRDVRGRVVRWFGTNTDVTEQREAEEKLKDADRRKDEFLAMLGHELRNPLAPVRSGLQLLQLGGDNPVERRATLDLMQRHIDHMVRLVDDLLDVSRIVRGKIGLQCKAVDLRAIIECAVEGVANQVRRRRQELDVDLPTEPLWIYGDTVRLVQVVENLLNNASKYNSDGGSIFVAADKSNEVITVRVRDSGVGIEPELLPTVFDLFTQSTRTLDRAEGGLGLGLSLVRNLVELHGGSITATSQGLGCGSEFIANLPAGKPPSKSVTRSPIRRVLPDRFLPLRILVVDDNRSAAFLVAKLLAKLGDHEVQRAQGGREALEKILRERPQLVFLDIGLPELDGYQVARRVRKVLSSEHVHLVALTGYGQEEDRRQSEASGFDEHLVKPISLDDLRQTLSRLSGPETP